MFCFDIKLKEFYAWNKQVTEARFNELKKINLEIFDGYKLKITEWVNEGNMTDQEKKENSEFYINKGYLKLRKYKEAWELRWAELPQDSKEKLLAIPELDVEIFSKITGIDVRKVEDEDIKKAIELLEAKGKIKDGKIIV